MINMSRRTHILGVVRPTIGAYLANFEQKYEFLEALFGDDHELWNRIGGAIDRLRNDFGKPPVTTHVDEWRRPYFDVLMDLIDFVQRQDGAMGFMKMKAIFDEDAGAFIIRALSTGVRVYHNSLDGDYPGPFPLPASFPNPAVEVRP